MLQARIVRSAGVSESTVSRVLTRAGLSKLSDLRPVEPVRRYEHESPGDLLHIDTKKLRRIMRPSHHMTGGRKDSADGACWEMPIVAIDGHARIAFTAKPRREDASVGEDALANYAKLGVTVRQLLTDNGAAFRSRDFARACVDLDVEDRSTRAHWQRTNGKAERFFQVAL